MSKGDGDKTEKPTPKRLRDSRKKGQVAKTEEAPVTVKFIVVTFFFYGVAISFFQSIILLIQNTFENINKPFLFAIADFTHHIGDISIQYGVPLGLALFFLIIASFVIQVGFLFVGESLKPSFKKVNPLEGFKKIFSKKSIFGLFKNIIRVVILGVVFYYLLKSHSNDFIFLLYHDVGTGLKFFGHMLFIIMTVIILFSLIITIIDYVMEKRKMMKDLMMSKSEIKREYKDSEGNPEIKSKRKEMHQEIQSGSLATNVKKSTAVVKNPTHIAVCLYYKLGKTPLPMVIEKQKGVLASEVIKIAIENNIPVVTNIPVARDLYSKTELGDYIPKSLMVPIAAILRSVIDFSSKEKDDED